MSKFDDIILNVINNLVPNKGFAQNFAATENQTTSLGIPLLGNN
jgi:hypothetical protein